MRILVLESAVFLLLILNCFALNNWWENEFIVSDDEILLEEGNNVIIAVVGSRRYVDRTKSGVARKYGVDQRNVHSVEFSSLSFSDSLFQQLPQLKNRRKKRSLLVLRGAETLSGSNMSRLDILLSLGDRTYDLADSVILVSYEVAGDGSTQPFENAEQWINYITGRLNVEAPKSNGNAIVGRLRRVDVQDFSQPETDDALTVTAEHQEGDDCRLNDTHASCIFTLVFVTAIYVFANPLFFVAIPNVTHY